MCGQFKKAALLAVAQSNKFLLTFMNENIEESDESSEEEEEEVMLLLINMIRSTLHPRERDIPRCENYFEIVMPQYLPHEFQSHFRMSPNAFDALCVQLIPRLGQKQKGRPLKNVKKQILAVIWLLATPDSYRLNNKHLFFSLLLCF